MLQLHLNPSIEHNILSFMAPASDAGYFTALVAQANQAELGQMSPNVGQWGTHGYCSVTPLFNFFLLGNAQFTHGNKRATRYGGKYGRVKPRGKLAPF